MLAKLESYGIDGPILDWHKMFLKQRSMRVLVDGENSDSVGVASGVPQGTVLGPLLFLCHINDLPETVKSQDHQLLQNDLASLEEWAEKWGMRFNAKKCYVMSVNNKSSHFYKLDNHILQQVQQNPYLGVIISDDLRWSAHIAKTVKKANSTLGFLRRNLRHCPKDGRKQAYIGLIRSLLEYASIVWDPYLIKDINALERVQRQAVRFISGDYTSREEGSIRRLMNELKLPTLENRRRHSRLTFLYKVAGELVPAIPQE
ncbi:Hypothetical predicted protein [Mytilus galloprovincialis]|uniref:Reverse transcriptase domain-containing protein n=1 Tax=Mytilus galloprovincialis TaxID=29158 RepID=A0A8B6CKN5_MYTGA|nr:Hypothetical predicted protein [Mytilus galloprovincialis]